MLKIKSLLGSAYLSLGVLLKITFSGLGKTNTARLGKTEVSIFSKVGFLLKYIQILPFILAKNNLIFRERNILLCVFLLKIPSRQDSCVTHVNFPVCHL